MPPYDEALASVVRRIGWGRWLGWLARHRPLHVLLGSLGGFSVLNVLCVRWAARWSGRAAQGYGAPAERSRAPFEWRLATRMTAAAHAVLVTTAGVASFAGAQCAEHSACR